ncbi:hypothetical protein [Micromonospora sp. CPCC 206061]|uniref:hypothetical protein n=1 Tax=Micromonospora sp. CPCC 206061 TaxID=3122410 RepID=UPI002FF2F41D
MGETLRKLTTRAAAVALALIGAVAGALVVAGPAQAAPAERISEAQVTQTTGRFSPVPGIWFDGSYVELRAGRYGGYQYGWAALAPGLQNWREGHAIVLQINRGDGNGWQWGPSRQNTGDGVQHTGGALTYASTSYRFRACLFNGSGYGCTNPW